MSKDVKSRKPPRKRNALARSVKSMDSGILSASSSDTAEACNFPVCVDSGIKDDVEGKLKFSPVILLERSKEAEKQAQQVICMNSEGPICNGKNLSGKCKKYGEKEKDSLISGIVKKNYENVKYNLRKFDKGNVQKTTTDQEDSISENIKLEALAVQSESNKMIHNIKITKHLFGKNSEKCTIDLVPVVFDQNTVSINKMKAKNRRKSKNSNIETETKNVKHLRRRIWKRLFDVPLAIEPITSGNIFFRGAVLEESPLKYMSNLVTSNITLSNYKQICSTEPIKSEKAIPEIYDSKEIRCIDLCGTVEEPTTDKIIPKKSPEMGSDTSSTQSRIRITFSTNLNERIVNNYMAVSPISTRLANNSECKNTLLTGPSDCFIQSQNEKCFVISESKDNKLALPTNIITKSPETDNNNRLVDEKFKFSSGRKKFDVNKLRDAMDKPIQYDQSSQKRKIARNDLSPKKLKITLDTVDTGEVNVSSGDITSNNDTCMQKIIVSPKQLLKTSFERNHEQFTDNANYMSSNCYKNNEKKSKFQCDLREHLNIQRGIFKTPVLPLAKRPPSRITPDILSKFGQKTTIAKDLGEDDCDVISLFAESLCEISKPNNGIRLTEACEGNNSETNLKLYPTEEEECQQNIKLDNFALDVPAVIESNTSAIKNKIAEDKLYSEHTKSTENEKSSIWSLKGTNSSVVHSVCSDNSSEVKDTSKVFEWIVSASHEELPKVCDTKLNLELRKFCYHKFKYGRCQYFGMRKCRFYHEVPEHFQNMILDLNSEQFKYTYNYVHVKLPFLFPNMFHVFVIYLKDQEKALINMINDVASIKKIEKKPYVIKIISALKDLGLSFEMAIEEIFITHGKEEWLMDILLDIAVKDQNCLENSWSLIQKLVNSQQHKNLDQGVITDIFNHCVYANPSNKEFCKNVFIDLVKTDKLNLFDIPEDKVIKYLNLLYSFHLVKYANFIEKKYNITPNEEIRNIVDLPNVHSETNSNSYEIMPTNFSNVSTVRSTDELYDESLGSVGKETEACINFPRDKNLNNNIACSSFITEPYIPTAKTQIVEKYVPTQPFVIHHENLRNDSYLNLYTERHCNENEIIDQQNVYENCESTTANNFLFESTCNALKGESDGTCNVRGTACAKLYRSIPSTSALSVEVENENNMTDLPNEDIIRISCTLKHKNISGILSLFAKYSSHLSRLFVIHLVTSLKNSVNPTELDFIVKQIFCSIDSLSPESLPSKLISTLQLFGVNILPYLDMHKKYETANIVLNKFSNDFSEFITIECVYPDFPYFSTPILRYLFIFKILTRGSKFKEALKLLKSLDSELYGKFFVNGNMDNYMDYKKRLIGEFLENTLKKNVPVAKDMLCFLIFKVNCSNYIDIEKYLNELLIIMLNRYSEYKIELISMFEIIVNSWYIYLQKEVLRALFIQFYNEIPERKILELYQINVSLDVYQAPEGNANSIAIPSDMLKEEIFILLHMYFYKLSKNNFPVKNIIIEIRPVLEDKSEILNVLINSRANCMEMKSRILNVLNKYPKPPSEYSNFEHCISLPYEDVQSLLDFYKSDGLPPLFKFR